MSWKTLDPRAAILGTEQNVSKDSSAGEWICIICISFYPYLCHFILFFLVCLKTYTAWVKNCEIFFGHWQAVVSICIGWEKIHD